MCLNVCKTWFARSAANAYKSLAFDVLNEYLMGLSWYLTKICEITSFIYKCIFIFNFSLVFIVNVLFDSMLAQ